MKQEAKVHKVIVCDKCKQHLWEFKILSYSEGKTFDDAKVGSTQWKSVNPLVKTSKPGKSWDCPICHRPFIHHEAKTGRKQMFMYDVNTKRTAREWI